MHTVPGTSNSSQLSMVEFNTRIIYLTEKIAENAANFIGKGSCPKDDERMIYLSI
jgi:hypothetical protein